MLPKFSQTKFFFHSYIHCKATLYRILLLFSADWNLLSNVNKLFAECKNLYLFHPSLRSLLSIVIFRYIQFNNKYYFQDTQNFDPDQPGKSFNR